MSFIVATNVVGSRPPKRHPSGTQTALAKKEEENNVVFIGH